MNNSSSHTEPSSPSNSELKWYKVISPISESRFPVYKVESRETNRIYALKVFSFEDKKPSKYFENESRFYRLTHPNIIKYYRTEAKAKTKTNGIEKEFSYILMEFAPYGDFATLLMQKILPRDEKLIRTYFHQLVEGVEYLHQNSTYHLDLKLDNLLLGEDFLLRIADFDNSFKMGDISYIGNGTRNYRAPEIKHKKVNFPAAADIYSMGIILFVMASGFFPYSETTVGSNLDKLWEYLLSGNHLFWEFHKIQVGENEIMTTDFKKLLMSMTKSKPRERASLREIRCSSWYRGPVYAKIELQEIMEKALGQSKKGL